MAEIEWPWVSRHRLEECERRLKAADEERMRYLDLLLEGGEDRRRVQTMVRPAEDPNFASEPQPPPNNEAIAFTTPFDRIEQRFAQSLAGGQRPNPKFRVRI